MDFSSEHTGLIFAGTVKSNKEVKSCPAAATTFALGKKMAPSLSWKNTKWCLQRNAFHQQLTGRMESREQGDFDTVTSEGFVKSYRFFDLSLNNKENKGPASTPTLYFPKLI